MRALPRHLLVAVMLTLPVSVAVAADLRILTHVLPPFTVAGTDRPTGLAVEMVEAIKKRTGDTGTPVIEPFPRVLRDVTTGPDTVAFIVARTPEREHLVRWVGPVLVSGVYLYKKAGSPVQIATLEDARKLASIGVTRGDADDTFLTRRLFGNLDRSESQGLDLTKVARGRVDVTPMSEIVFSSIAAAAGLQPGDFERTPVKLYDSDVYIAFSPDVPGRVVDTWTAALCDMKASGEFGALLARYGIDRHTIEASQLVSLALP